MTIIKLAFRNLIGAGLKTWLRVAVLSIAFVTIIAMQGLYEGMSLRAERAGTHRRGQPSWRASRACARVDVGASHPLRGAP